MPQMCTMLSTSAWISLLIRIVEGHQSFNAITLQRQVEGFHEVQGKKNVSKDFDCLSVF